MLQALEAHAYTIVNKTFEDTVGIERERIEDDQYGVYAPVIEQLGWDAKTHPDQLIFGMMKAAVTGSPVTIGKITIPVPICYDGNNLYYALHPAGPAGESSSVANTTCSNVNSSGSGAYWFLVDAARPIKPFIFQKRREYAVTRMNTATDVVVEPAFPSFRVTLLMEMLGPSSSMIVAVTCWVPDSVPLLTLEISAMIVSSTSSMVSWTAVRVIEPLVLQGGMTIEVPEAV